MNIDQETQTENNQAHPSIKPETMGDSLLKRSPIPVTPQLFILLFLLFILVSSALTPKLLAQFQTTPSPNEVQQNNITEAIATYSFTKEEQEAAYSEMVLQAKAAFVWDIQDQRTIFAKNETETLPIASITKLMTALVAHELLDEDTTIIIDETSAKQDSATGLGVGQSYDRMSLTDLILLSSSNDGAYALATNAGKTLDTTNAAEAFVAAMNIRAEEIGLIQTVFHNPTGLDISESQAGAYSTAKDIAFLMEYLLTSEPDLLEPTQLESARLYADSGSFIDAHNTNYYIDEVPGLLGSKTGFTYLAGGNLAITYTSGFNRPIVVVVLGSTQQGRFTDVLQLVQRTTSLLGNE